MQAISLPMPLHEKITGLGFRGWCPAVVPGKGFSLHTDLQAPGHTGKSCHKQQSEHAGALDPAQPQGSCHQHSTGIRKVIRGAVLVWQVDVQQLMPNGSAGMHPRVVYSMSKHVVAVTQLPGQVLTRVGVQQSTAGDFVGDCMLWNSHCNSAAVSSLQASMFLPAASSAMVPEPSYQLKNASANVA